jgi:sugar/nucleoside kinase (ribokinase family)
MRIAVTGEISHDRLSQPGLQTWQGLGGCAVYLSLALGRLGADVIFATIGGDDVDAAWLAPLYQAHVKLQILSLAGPTARLELAYDQNGDIAHLCFEAGVESQMQADHLSADFWSADWIAVGTAPRAYQTEVIRRGDGLGHTVALSTQREFQDDWPGLAALLPSLDVLFMNSGEVVDLGGGALPGAIEMLQETNPHLTCLITCGRRGALMLHMGRLYQVAACPGPVVNTTGAGDAFAAAWLRIFSYTEDPIYGLRGAAVAASLALQGLAHTALPTWSEVTSKLAACQTQILVESWPVGSSGARAALSAEDMHCHRPLDRRVVRS